MEEQEIRLGNYLQYRDKSSLLTVDSLGSNGFSTINQDGIQYGSDDISEYNPIPLTEDWLLKLGFKHSGNGFFIHAKSLIELANIGDEYFHSGIKGISLINIHFVHQLQNLFFSLCGEELNVK